MLNLEDVSLGAFNYNVQDGSIIEMEFLSMQDGSTVLKVEANKILSVKIDFAEDYAFPLYIGQVLISQLEVKNDALYFPQASAQIWCIEIEGGEVSAKIYCQAIEVKSSGIFL